MGFNDVYGRRDNTHMRSSCSFGRLLVGEGPIGQTEKSRPQLSKIHDSGLFTGAYDNC